MTEEAQDDLRATSESISADADRLKAIEAQKRALDPGDPRLAELAAEGERIGAEIAAKTTIESDIADEIANEAEPHA